ncbi:MAG: hypothetical protein D6794_00305, partial [Deltaproteobacteria bacterium]
QAAGYAGRVSYVAGQVFVERNGDRLAASADMRLYEHDVLVTETGGRAKVRLRDGSVLYVGQRSRLNIARYRMSGSRLLTGLFEQLWGRVRYVVAKLASDRSSFNVHTTTAVIGVRGTEFTVLVQPPAQIQPIRGYLPLERLKARVPSAAQAPVSVALFSGKISLRTGQRQTLLKPGRLAIIQKPGALAIRRIRSGQVKQLKDVFQPEQSLLPVEGGKRPSIGGGAIKGGVKPVDRVRKVRPAPIEKPVSPGKPGAPKSPGAPPVTPAPVSPTKPGSLGTGTSSGGTKTATPKATLPVVPVTPAPVTPIKPGSTGTGTSSGSTKASTPKATLPVAPVSPAPVSPIKPGSTGTGTSSGGTKTATPKATLPVVPVTPAP